MASKIKVDQIQTGDGTGTIALQNQLSGMTSASMPTGSVLQVVQATTTTQTASASTVYVSTAITAAITPSSTSNKILVSVTSNMETNASGEQAWFSIYNGSSDIAQGYLKQPPLTGSPVYPIAIDKLDSPSSTSAVTYTLRMKATSSTIVANIGTSIGVITLMEIAG